MTVYLWIAAGGAIGSTLRFWLSSLVSSGAGHAFPWGTLVVNVLGSFVIGFFAGCAGPLGTSSVSDSTRHFIMTGVLGGFTTFSAFSLQTLALARDGAWLKASGNVVGSVSLCLLAVWLGYVVAVWCRARV